MTTLPQTATTRLPALGGAGGPAGLPAAYTAVPSVAGGAGMTGADAWRVIRGSLWLVILFAILFGVAGFFLHRALLRGVKVEVRGVPLIDIGPEYEATGLVQIKTSQLANPVTGQKAELSQLSMQGLQRTHAQLMMADATISQAIQKDELRKTSWAKRFTKPDGTFDASEAKEHLRKNVSVSPIPESELIRVTARYRVPTDAKAIVEELVKTHLLWERAQAENSMEGDTRALREVQANVNARLQQVSSRARDKQLYLLQKGLGGAGMFSTKELTLRTLLSSQMELAKEAASSKQAFQTISAQLERGETPAVIEQAIESDGAVNGLARQISDLSIQRDFQMDDGKGPENQTIKRTTRLIELTQKQLDVRRAELRVKYRNQLVEKLRGAMNESATALAEVTTKVDALVLELSELSKEHAALLIDQEEERGLRAQKTEMDNRLRDIQAISNPENQARIKWASMPGVPEVPTFPRRLPIMAGAIMLGIGLALGIAFLREFLDDTVRSPRDVVRVQMSMLGMISDEADDPQLADAQLAIFDAPHSLTAEQFRQMRTRLQHAASLDTCRSIMITGPNPESGKTTVAANLGAGLALNGRKILLVDANFRRPDLHRLFGTTNEKGFSDVLTGHAVLEDTVFHTRVPNLTILPAGAKLVNATELFESQLLIDFIERALEDYDHVIFDSGPLLVVSEAVAMAPRVDGVITVVRAHSESRGLLQRMRDELRKIKAEHLGVVLNAVRARGGGYYGRLARTYYDYQSAA